MKQFKDLYITGPDVQLLTFVKDIAANLPSGWHRDIGAEERMARLAFGGEEAGFAFARDATGDGLPPTGLFLARERGRLHIPNIVPRESGQLSVAQYNQILDEFADILRRCLPNDRVLEMRVTSDEATITDWVSQEAAVLLKKFSVLANMSTGSSHPNDFQRWAAFLIKVHKDCSTLDSDTLSQWLVEELGWPAGRANELAIEYEFARNLLRAYDESQ